MSLKRIICAAASLIAVMAFGGAAHPFDYVSATFCGEAIEMFGDAENDWATACLGNQGQALINKFWDDFGMGRSGGNWTNEFGYDRPCDLTLPLGRTFSAIHLLSRLTDSVNRQQGWYYDYSKARVGKLVAHCHDPDGVAARHYHGWFREDRTELYIPYYRNFLTVRAAIIAHEARHDDDYPHVDCRGIEEFCDENFLPYDGAYAYDVHVLWDIVKDQVMSPAYRAEAGFSGNIYLANRFIQDPGIIIEPRSYCPPAQFAGARYGWQCDICLGAAVPSPDQLSCIACPVGEAPDVATGTTCVPCPGGSVVKDSGCLPCGRGFVPDPTRTMCMKCPVGTVTDPNGSRCIPCKPNEVARRGVCERCSKETPCSECGGQAAPDPFSVTSPRCDPCCADGTCPDYVPNAWRGMCVPCTGGKVANASGACCVDPAYKDTAHCGPPAAVGVPNVPGDLYLKLPPAPERQVIEPTPSDRGFLRTVRSLFDSLLNRGKAR